MNIESIILELQQTGMILVLVDGQLAVKEESIKGVPENALAKLTANREHIKLFLKEKEKQDVRPYIDEHYNMGQGSSGCLVIPMNCAEQYKYWKSSFDCVPVETDDWSNQKNSKKELKKFHWRPMNLESILSNLNVSYDLKKRYL